MVIASFMLASALACYFNDLPEGTDPGTVSRRVTDQFLSTRPENYRPVGYHGNEGYGWNWMVQYSVVSLWINALDCARQTGDDYRKGRLLKLYDDFRPNRRLFHVCSKPYHVDDSIFGALPYEIYLTSGDANCLEQGNWYADTHAPDVPFVWARGAGWMAAGMALVLDRLPEDSPHFAKIKSGYLAMMDALLKYQRKDEFWCQLVDCPKLRGQALMSYPEMSPRTRALLTASARVEASRARKIFLRLSFTVS